MSDVDPISSAQRVSVEKSTAVSSPETTDIVVTARRKRAVANGLVKPVRSMDAARITAYRARSIGELINAVSMDTQSLQGNQEPIILVNGRPLAGLASIKNFPPEALAQLEIYPEEAAPHYGSANKRRVINLVTKSRFTAIEGEGNWQTATDGGQQGVEASTQWSRVSGDRRASFSLKLRRESLLRESERGIRSPDNDASLTLAYDDGIFDDSAIHSSPGTVSAQLSQSFKRSANTGRYRSLLPRTSNLELNGTLTTPITEKVTASVDAKLVRDVSTALRGPGVITLAAAPFSGNRTVSVYDHLDNVPPLKQSTVSTNFQANLSLNGNIGRWMWTTNAAIDHSRISTRTDTTISVAPLSDSLSSYASSLHPSTNFLAPLAEWRSRDVALLQTDTFSVSNQFNGRLIRIAKRDIFGRMELSWTGVRQSSSSIINDDKEPKRNLRQSKFKTDIAIDIPIVRPGSIVGEITSAVNASVAQTTGFGPFTAAGYTLSWFPIPGLHLSLSKQRDMSPPDPLQLSAPVISTPGVTVFDYIKGEDVRVLAISGGNPSLRPERRETLNLDFAYTLNIPTPLQLSFGYARTSVRDGVMSVPAPSQAAQAAFPDYFVRSPEGKLLSIDTRSVNLAASREDQLRTAITISPKINRGHGETPGESSSDHLSLMLAHVWSIGESYQLQAGGPELDILDGDGVIGGEGRSRHALSFTGQMSINEVGLNLTGAWKSGFRLALADSNNALHFSNLMTWNVNLSMDLNRFLSKSYTDAHRSPLQGSLTITNLFNSRQRVRNTAGETPVSYQPAYLDPLGRKAAVSLRKLF